MVSAPFRYIVLLILSLGLSFSGRTQGTDFTSADEDPPPFDASGFGDADEGKVTRYCTQKVTGQSPTKLIYAGYDYQHQTDIIGNEFTGLPKETVRSVPGVRAFYSTPVVSRADVILNLAAQYTGTRFRASSVPLWTDAAGLDDGWFHSIGLQATLFKPLNERHFILSQVSADHNIQNFSFDSRAVTLSALALFGWKPTDRLMWGVGAARTYRLGAVIHVPVVYYYHTYSSRLGAEAVLPARAHLRYNLNKRSLLMAGYELEGQQYLLTGSRVPPFAGPFLRRGEIRPRLMYERSLAGFFWLSVQAGVRINGRFSLSDDYGADGDDYVVSYDLSPTPYGQIGVALVSP